jgi:hypothetical protein
MTAFAFHRRPSLELKIGVILEPPVPPATIALAEPPAEATALAIATAAPPLPPLPPQLEQPTPVVPFPPVALAVELAMPLVEFDWKTTGRSAITRKTIQQMDKHAGHVKALTNGRTLATQESRSWTDYVLPLLP